MEVCEQKKLLTMSTIISVIVDGKEYIFDELILDNILNYLNIINFLNLGKINSELLKYIKQTQRFKQLQENKIKINNEFLYKSFIDTDILKRYKDNIDIAFYFTKSFTRLLDLYCYKRIPQKWQLNSEITLNFIKNAYDKWRYVSYFSDRDLPKIHYNDYNIMKCIISLNYRHLLYASNELKENSDLFELACCSILKCDMDNISNIREDYYCLRKILLYDNSLYKIFPKSLFKNVKLIIFGMKYCKVFYDLFKEQHVNKDLLFNEITKKDIFWFNSELFKDEEFVLNILQYSKLDNHWPFMLLKHYNHYILDFSKKTLLQIVKLVPHSIKLYYPIFTTEELQELSLSDKYIANYLKKCNMY